MNHRILPRCSEGSQSREALAWVEKPSLSLGGCFYDYLRTAGGEVVGVRYWTIDVVEFRHHPVYSKFGTDSRFLFNQEEGYVDIVFDERDVDLLASRSLAVDSVQDFGGESVLQCGDQIGIAFDIPEEAGSPGAA